MDEDLKNLISDWAFRRERRDSPVAFSKNPRLPEWLPARLTGVEPFRSRAIEDALIYWAMPLPFGFGMELFFPDALEIAPFENWRESVHRFVAEMEYCERMEGTDCYRYNVKLERIGRESGAWRIIEVFSEGERAQFLKIFEMMKHLNAPQESQENRQK